ncbi:MAG: hypothetical protein ACR2IK_00680 [Chloroflexota bacterium]
MSRGPSSNWTCRHESALALGLSALLVWAAQFHHFRDLGLYEDDYFFISEAMGKPPTYLLNRLQTAITVLPQGRPLGFFLPDLFSFVGDKLGGLATIYLLGFALVTLNTFLCYRLLRVRLPLAPSVVGAAVFCLFPADTTKILLTHDFQLQPSLTFALLAALAYAAERRPLAYVLGAGALLSYENGYLALFALPLFVRRWDRSLPRAVLAHALALLGVLAVVVLARIARGEGRATESVGGLGQIVPAFLASLVLGPARSLAAMFYGPLKAIPGWDVEPLALAVVALVGLGALLWVAGRGLRSTELHRRDALQVAAAGAAMLVLGYGLAFTHFPPNAIVGRGTSVHLGATLGMSVLAGSVAWLLLSVRRRVATAVLAAYLALALGYYVTIERDFMQSWQLQRSFWQQVVGCCSDLQDGTVLLYELTATDEPTTFIFTNSWADPLVLGETFAFPAGWANPPRLFSLTQWVDRVQPEGDHLRWWVPGASWDEHWEVLPQANVILLRRGPDGGLTRISGSVEVAGHSLELKPPAAPMTWPAAQLYEPLLK